MPETTHTPGFIRAARLISDVTRGRCWVDSLTGRHNVKTRQAIMQALKGRKVTQAESGINALKDSLAIACGVTDWTCLHDRDTKLHVELLLAA